MNGVSGDYLGVNGDYFGYGMDNLKDFNVTDLASVGQLIKLMAISRAKMFSISMVWFLPSKQVRVKFLRVLLLGQNVLVEVLRRQRTRERPQQVFELGVRRPLDGFFGLRRLHRELQGRGRGLRGRLVVVENELEKFSESYPSNLKSAKKKQRQA